MVDAPTADGFMLNKLELLSVVLPLTLGLGDEPRAAPKPATDPITLELLTDVDSRLEAESEEEV